MPTYDYLCQACGHEFEQIQNITAGALRKCPECKKLRLKRLIGTGGGIIFKGSGFYETDYRSSSYREGQKKETDGGSKSGEGSAPNEAKTENAGCAKKPDTSTDAGSERTSTS